MTKLIFAAGIFLTVLAIAPQMAAQEEPPKIPVDTQLTLDAASPIQRPAIQSVLYIQCKKTNMKGTAFAVSGGYVVTAAHVVCGCDVGDLEVVAKLSADGSHLIYSTYLGGSGAEGGFHISVDSAGNALVAGITQSQDFPTTPGAVALGTGQGLLTKLDPTGSHLVFSTTGPFWNGVTTDAGGNVYLAGGGDPAAVISSNAVQDKLRTGPSCRTDRRSAQPAGRVSCSDRR